MAVLLQPRIEAEVAFVLKDGLDRADLDLAVVRSAVDYAVAALEIVDSRIAGWDITLVDTVADNASCGLYVLGSRCRPLTGLGLPALTMTMTAGGEVVSEGTGAACLGDPAEALLWLARTARDFGSSLRAGDLVLSGALGPMVPVVAGTTYVAVLDGLGTVRASFGTNRHETAREDPGRGHRVRPPPGAGHERRPGALPGRRQFLRDASKERILRQNAIEFPACDGGCPWLCG
jgi:2-keto-4-pentenoate hydratase